MRLLILIICIFFIHRFCHRATGGFTLLKIQSHHAYTPKWDTPPLSLEEKQALAPLFNQKFSFFSYGGQAYVFLSEDKTTVLKVFKQHHLRMPHWLKKLPLIKPLKKFRNKLVRRREETLDLFFDSCLIANDRFKEQTGLLYVHLNPTEDLNQQLTLIDKLGIEHQIDLDHTDFILQQRTRLAPRHFLHLKRTNDIEGARISLDSLLDLMVARCQKGIADRDPNLRRNCGFIGNRAVEIDIGSYSDNPVLKLPFAWRMDLYQKTLQLKRMINKRFPELSDYLSQRIEELLILPQEDRETPATA